MSWLRRIRCVFTAHYMALEPGPPWRCVECGFVSDNHWKFVPRALRPRRGA